MMESTSLIYCLLCLFLPFFIVVPAHEVSALPAFISEEDRIENHTETTNSSGTEQLIFLATAPFSKDVSVCSSAYSCYEACAEDDYSSVHVVSNVSRRVILNTMENICFCDSRCQIFADCCYDYDLYCAHNNTDEDQHIHLSTKKMHYSATNYPEVDGTSFIEEQESFECINVDQYPSSSFWAKTVCRSDWKDAYVSDLCLNPDPDDMLTQLPVIDTDKTVYRNAFCAECNGIWTYKFMLLDSVCQLFIPSNIINKRQLFSAFLKKNCVTYIRSGFSEPPRSCLKTLNTCPKSSYNIDVMQKINEGCDGPTQFPVLSYENPNKPVIYKNPECAVCNGSPARKQRCFKFYPENDAAAALNGIVGLNRGSIIEHTDIYGKLYMDSKEVQENKKDELHHVIINYNSDMTRTVIVNEDDRYIVPIVHECPYGAVFDPFQGQCRQIHCESGYVLEGNECVLDINIQGIVNSLTELASGVADGRNGTPMGHRFKLIITVNVSMDGRPVLEFLKNNSVLQRFVSFLNTTELISEESKENATSAFSPMRPRWLNSTEIDATYNASGDGQVLIVLTFTPSLPSFDLSFDVAVKEFLQNLDNDHSLVVAADYEVYVDDKEVDTNGLNLKTFIDVVTTHLNKLWYVITSCEESLRIHHSSELTFSKESERFCLNVSVSGQNDWHGCNETIFFAYNTDQGLDGQDFYVLLCDSTSVLPADCPRIWYNVSEYTVLPNHTAVVENGQTYHRDEYEINDGYLVVCSNFTSQINEIYVFFFGFTIGQIYMTFILGGVSDICLILTIITYIIFKELRTLPGLNLLGLMVANICCNCSLLLGVTNSIGSNVCVVGAIFIHYYTLANLCWMTSIAFDAYLTFGGNRRQTFTHFRSNYPKSKRYMLYSCFAWGVPGSLVGLGVIFNYCECGPFPVWYGRYISCWINDPYGFLYLFTIPASLILLSNYILFVLAISGIKSSQFQGSSQLNKLNFANAKKDIAVYIKLLTTTGFGWVFGYIAAISEITALWSLFLILVSLQGVFIFLAFFCNRRVLLLYVNLIKGNRKDRLARGSSSTAMDSSRAIRNKSALSISENVTFDTHGKNELGFDASEFQKNNKSVNEERVSKSTTDDNDEVPEDDVIIAKCGENNKGFDLSKLQENENSTKVGMVAKEVDEMADDDVGITNIHKEDTLDEVFL